MISIFLPTRKRPDRLLRTVQSIFLSRSKAEACEILAYISDCDDSYDNWHYEGVRKIRGPRVTMSDLWNRLIPYATGDIFMLCADDVIFRTPDWDVEIEKAFAAVSDKILLAYADDGSPNGKRFATLPFVSRRWVDIVGYFSGPGFSANYSDTWPQDVAEMIGRKVYVDVLIEHCHHVWNKAEKDVVYEENEERDRRDNNEQRYKDRLPERVADAVKLQATMGTSYDPDDEIKLPPKWSILILTQPSRLGFFRRLIGQLIEQTSKFDGIEVLVRTFEPALSLGENRQALIDAARGEFTNFIDDDDEIADDYVEEIYRALLLEEEIDVVGFKVQCYIDGKLTAVADHSVKNSGWTTGDGALLKRDFSHLNPLRRSIMQFVKMEGGRGEDFRWAAKMRAMNLQLREHYLDRVMYHYYFRSDRPKELQPARTSIPAAARSRCPYCHSEAAPSRFHGGIVRCNECGRTRHE